MIGLKHNLGHVSVTLTLLLAAQSPSSYHIPDCNGIVSHSTRDRMCFIYRHNCKYIIKNLIIYVLFAARYYKCQCHTVVSADVVLTIIGPHGLIQ